MTPFVVSGFLIVLTCFALATWIILRAPRTLLNNLMAAFNVCVGVWGLGCMLAGMAKTPEHAIWAWRLAHAGGFPLGVTFFHVVLVLNESRSRRIVVMSYGFSVVAVLLCVSGLAMRDTAWLFDSLHYFQANIPYVAIFITWVAIVVIGHTRLVQAARQATGKRRTQLWFVFFAFATGFIGGTSALLPFIGVSVYPYGNFSIPVYALILTYAIVKYRVIETRVVMTRAGLLLAVYLIVLGAPFLLARWGRTHLEQLFGGEWWLVPLSLSTVLATAGPFAYAYLRRQAEERLLREQRRYQRTLQHAARGMTQVRNVTKLSKLVTRVVSGSVRVTHASLFLWDKAQRLYLLKSSHGPKRLALQSRYGLEPAHPLTRWLIEHRQIATEETIRVPDQPLIQAEMAQLEAVLIVPGLIERDLVGFLVLGPKLSGEVYSSDDLHAFTTLANEAAIAIENASSYEELLRVNEQLKAASERLLLQERLAAAGQFAMGMAHEIKNPLSAIKTFSQYLPEKYADAAFREKFFRIVQAEIDRINEIVKELSDFAKPAPLQLQPVKLSELVKDTLALLSNQCLKQAVDIRISFSENGLAIQGDPQQLKQVLLNLLLNSLEAMPEGGTLEVSAERNHQFVALRIHDTGCGVSSEHLREIWDPFFTTKERGMGLGLAIVKGIVERHGGQIILSSTQGKSTIVEVCLPISH